MPVLAILKRSTSAMMAAYSTLDFYSSRSHPIRQIKAKTRKAIPNVFRTSLLILRLSTVLCNISTVKMCLEANFDGLKYRD